MVVKVKLTPRRLMELALELMRHSVPDALADGKNSPKVVAVLVKSDGAVEG